MPKGRPPLSDQFVTLTSRGIFIPPEILIPGVGVLFISVLGGVMAGTILFELKDVRDNFKEDFGEPLHLRLPSAGFRRDHGPQ